MEEFVVVKKTTNVIHSYDAKLKKMARGLKTMVCFTYSHFSNKREVTLTDFEKFHPPQKKIHPPRLLIS